MENTRFASSLVSSIRKVVKYYKSVNKNKFYEEVIPESYVADFDTSISGLVDVWEEIEASDSGGFYLINPEKEVGKEEEAYYEKWPLTP